MFRNSGKPLGNGPMKAITAIAALVLCLGAQAQATGGDVSLDNCTTGVTTRSFALKNGESVDTWYNVSIGMGRLYASVGADTNCTGSSTSLACLMNKVNVNVPPEGAAGTLGSVKITVKSSGPVTVNSMNPADMEALWSTDLGDAPDAKLSCSPKYKIHITSSGGGWGDPHLTTVDGVQYDFQSDGEFTALRKSGFELQTRQTAVPSASVPIRNDYTGLTHCVAVYTAVAAKFGASRITLQPGLAKDEVNPERMQLRVNGRLMELGNSPIVLRSGNDNVGRPGGRFDGLIRKGPGSSIEMSDADGTQVLVTPAFWQAHNIWYLNVEVFQTSAIRGTLGRIPPGSWLPALPDGSSLGPRPTSENQRYEDLYVKFADAWRVTTATSLFDYASGQDTATFTLAEWPRNNPKSCDLAGRVSVQGTTQQAAAQACAAVTDPVRKANCEFDVMVTGHTGFGQSYVATREFKPRGAGWVEGDPQAGDVRPTSSTPPWWQRWWWLIVIVLLLIALLIKLLTGRSTPP